MPTITVQPNLSPSHSKAWIWAGLIPNLFFSSSHQATSSQSPVHHVDGQGTVPGLHSMGHHCISRVLTLFKTKPAKCCQKDRQLNFISQGSQGSQGLLLLQIYRTTKVWSLIQQSPSSQPWAGPQPYEPELHPSLLTQNGGWWSERADSFHLSPHGLLTGGW